MAIIGNMNDNGPLTHRTREFYMYQTIQRTYNFMVMFDESRFGGVYPGAIKDVNGDLVVPPIQQMTSFMALSVDIPNYSFEKQQIKFGDVIRTFPTLNHEGFVFSMRLVEDDSGRVKRMIDFLTSSIVDEDGYYNHLSDATFESINVDIFRPDGHNIWKVKFLNSYFLKLMVGLTIIQIMIK